MIVVTNMSFVLDNVGAKKLGSVAWMLASNRYGKGEET